MSGYESELQVAKMPVYDVILTIDGVEIRVRATTFGEMEREVLEHLRRKMGTPPAEPAS